MRSFTRDVGIAYSAVGNAYIRVTQKSKWFFDFPEKRELGHGADNLEYRWFGRFQWRRKDILWQHASGLHAVWLLIVITETRLRRRA